MTKTILEGLTIGILALGVTACSSASSPVAPESEAVKAQGQAEPAQQRPSQATEAKRGALSNEQYTVFAPTDLAFVTTLAAADEAAAIAAVNALSPEALKNILLYHVTNGRRNSASVLGAPGYQMLNGDRLTRATLTAAGIAQTDISASNGIVHVINAVLLP
jgi:uncharacterized surface protein with fasciclin (FAS1) repeats